MDKRDAMWKDYGRSNKRMGMSKYERLWSYIKDGNTDRITLTFEEIGKIAGVPIDHSFLRYKKELTEYGYEVQKISMKEQKVTFLKC